MHKNLKTCHKQIVRRKLMHYELRGNRMLELLLAYSRCSHWLYFSVITCVNGVPDCALCVKFPPLKKKVKITSFVSA